jgi:hypothetical protein
LAFAKGAGKDDMKDIEKERISRRRKKKSTIKKINRRKRISRMRRRRKYKRTIRKIKRREGKEKHDKEHCYAR